MRNILRTVLAPTALGIGLVLAPVASLAQRAPLSLARHPSAAPRHAASLPSAMADVSDRGHLILEAGSGRVVSLPGAVANVFVADPKIAEVRPASPTSLFLFGVGAGHTTVAALDAAGHPIRQYDVTVRPSSFGAGEAAGAIARSTPDGSVQVEARPKSLTLTGRVNSPAESQAAAANASAFVADGQTVDDQLKVASSIQVGLRVRIAEMSRSVTRALGINWQSLGTIGKLAVGLNTANQISQSLGAVSSLAGAFSDNRGNSVTGLLDALAGDNLVHMLAEPNLTAMSGETASFLVGGEFPIPVAQQQGTISVSYKEYGVALSFVPTVLAEDRIRIHVRPEVSQLSTVGAVQLNGGNVGISVPGLIVRRAETTVELGSGQSFAIAGLLQDQNTDTVNALPGIGEVPILGPLFRSDAFQRNETELVIIVTPYIVRPVSDPNALKLATDGFKPPNDLERLLLLRQVGRPTPVAAQQVPGQAGFVVE